MNTLSFSTEAQSKSWLSKKVLPVVKKIAKPALNVAATIFPPLMPVASVANLLIK
jgi:hypothetical protein